MPMDGNSSNMTSNFLCFLIWFEVVMNVGQALEKKNYKIWKIDIWTALSIVYDWISSNVQKLLATSFVAKIPQKSLGVRVFSGKKKKTQVVGWVVCLLKILLFYFSISSAGKWQQINSQQQSRHFASGQKRQHFLYLFLLNKCWKKDMYHWVWSKVKNIMHVSKYSTVIRCGSCRLLLKYEGSKQNE